MHQGGGGFTRWAIMHQGGGAAPGHHHAPGGGGGHGTTGQHQVGHHAPRGSTIYATIFKMQHNTAHNVPTQCTTL